VHQFVRHLRKDRGLAEGTIRWHRRYLRYFLNSLGFDRGRMTVRKLELIHVHRFVRQMSRRCSRLTMKSVVDFIRGFLRFQFLKGALRQPLHTRIDTVRVYQEERLPHPLPWAELQKLLGRKDRSTALGSRDFTILLLAAAYGLRQSELAALTLDDLDWRARRVRISQSKTRQTLLLPLTDEVGAALVDYLRRGRPASADRHLFLRQRPPLGPLGVTGVARRLGWAVQTTGVKIGTMSFHGLRHAFALRLLRQGTALKNISDLLGHRDPNSTASYLRLNLDDFRPVALPVPRPRVAETKRRAASRLPTQPGASKALQRAAGTVTDTTGLDSFLAKSLRDYLAMQRALGRAYRHVEWILRTLDWVLRRDFPNGRIFTKAMFDRWAMKQAVLSPNGRRYRMLSVRKFCLFLARLRPTTFVPNLKSFPKALPPQAPYLLTRSEMSRILTKTKTVKLGWQNPFRRQTPRRAGIYSKARRRQPHLAIRDGRNPQIKLRQYAHALGHGHQGQGLRLDSESRRNGNAPGTLSARFGKRHGLHQYLFAPGAKLRPRYVVAAAAGVAEKRLAENPVQRQARHRARNMKKSWQASKTPNGGHITICSGIWAAPNRTWQICTPRTLIGK
jgi:site-specific recombinase XerD